MIGITSNVLYECTQLAEWTQDYEVLEEDAEKCTKLLNIRNYVNDIFKTFGASDADICKYVSFQLPWRISVRDKKTEFLALLQDDLLEIRSKNDNFSTLVGQAIVPLDKLSKWRQLEWSWEQNLIATSTSDGLITCYNMYGDNLLTIRATTKFSQFSRLIPAGAIAGLFFANARAKNTAWIYEIIAINYSGELHCYQISKNNQSKEDHNFYFGNSLPVSAATYDYVHNIMLVAFPIVEACSIQNKNYKSGLSAWRLLNEFPYYKILSPTKEELFSYKCHSHFGAWIPGIFKSQQKSVIIRMRVSEEADFLACLHSCGAISIWYLPSLRLYKIWSLDEQLCYKTGDCDTNFAFHPIDINWSSSKKLVVIRGNGLICMYNIETMVELLENNAEFLGRNFGICNICNIDLGFLILEVKVKKFRQHDPTDRSTICEISAQEEDEKGGNEIVVAEMGYYRKMFDFLRNFLHYSKSPNVMKSLTLVQKIYQLHCIRSMTPEEVYQKKIDCGEYEEALEFAELYNLDKNHVYQRQWRNNPVSEESIINCLTKITNRFWVLHECGERLPESLSAAEYLLNFGLELTEFDIFSEYKDTERITEIMLEPFRENDIDFTQSQLNLLQMRKQLLKYSDRLRVYKMILEESDMLSYNKESYDKFRLESPVDIAISYARNGDHYAVELLLIYYNDETMPHWLDILSNFPETLKPEFYKHLLPKYENGEIVEITKKKLRDDDWSEGSNLKFIVNIEDFDTDFDISSKLSKEQVFEWYKNRIRNIEENTGLIQYALEFLDLALSYNIPGLVELQHDLLLLSTIAFDLCNYDITLSEIEKKSDVEKLKLLLNDSDKDTFPIDFEENAIPFLARCEDLIPGAKIKIMEDYFQELCKTDLSFLYILFDSMTDQPELDIFSTLSEKIIFAMHCLYSSENVEQTDLALGIIQILRVDEDLETDPEILDLYQQLDDLEGELNAQNLLRKHYNIVKTTAFIHENTSNATVAKDMLIELTDYKLKKIQNLDKDLEILLRHLIWFQSNIFNVISKETCLEIFAYALLTSSENSYIMKASIVLSCTAAGQLETDYKISYDKSVDLVLDAARQHFNCANSYNDKEIKASGLCLKLIKDENTTIEEELDLIEALNLLHQFGINSLPFQVRSAENKLRFIDNCLEKSKFAYKKSDRLLKLAACFRIFGEDRKLRQGTVLVKVAERAFHVKDYTYCANTCMQLIDIGCTFSWEMCQKLCECSEYSNYKIEQKLIRFALLNCPPSVILGLVKVRNELEYKILQENVREMMFKLQNDGQFVASKNQKNPNRNDELIDEKSNEVIENSIEPIVSLIKNFSLPSSELLTLQFWKNTFTLSVSDDETIYYKNENCDRLGFPPFYGSLHSKCDCYISPVDDLLRSDTHLQFVSLLLRYNLLHSEINGPNSEDIGFNRDAIISQIGISILPNDFYHSLCYLLTLSDVKHSENAFSGLPHTLVLKKIAFYYYVLKYALQNNLILVEDILNLTPSQLILKTYNSNLSNDNSTLANLVAKYKCQIENFRNVTKLHQLDCGIDVNRFFSDIDYRTDSVLGLAMSTENEKLELALALAAENEISSFEVIMSHLTHLFLNGEHTAVMERMNNQQFVDLVKENSVIIKERLKNTIYEVMYGFNYQLIVAFYTLMNLIVDEGEVFHHLTPKEHIKLLKKVKATSDCIDYKRLTADKPNIVAAVLPALNMETVSAIVKFVRSLPTIFKDYGSPKDLYEALVKKTFFNSVNRLSPSIHQLKIFETCTEYFAQMSEEAVLNFVYEAVFSNFTFHNGHAETKKELLNISIEVSSNSNMSHMKQLTSKFLEWDNYYTSLLELHENTDEFKKDNNLFRLLLFALFCKSDRKEFVVNCIRNHKVPLDVSQMVAELLLPDESFSNILKEIG